MTYALATGADTALYRPVESTGDLLSSFWDSLYGLQLRPHTLRTGQDTMRAPHQSTVRNLFALIEAQTGKTGYGWISAPALHSYVLEGSTQDLDETESYEPAVLLAAEPRIDSLVAIDASPALPMRSPEATAVERIASLTGLEMERLSDLLQVSRTTLYAWLAGSKPRGRKRDHLLQVASVMEEVARRFDGPRSVAAWLLSPTSASGRLPFDVLKEQRYALCRGMLTRRTAERPALPIRAPRPLAASELRASMERQSARPFSDDYEAEDQHDK